MNHQSIVASSMGQVSRQRSDEYDSDIGKRYKRIHVPTRQTDNEPMPAHNTQDSSIIDSRRSQQVEISLLKQTLQAMAENCRTRNEKVAPLSNPADAVKNNVLTAYHRQSFVFTR